MIKKLLLSSILIFAFYSCGTSSRTNRDYASYRNSIFDTDKHMKEIKLGMSKKEVIYIMGENFEVLSAKGNKEILGYRSYDYYIHGIYKLSFIDNKLVEWEKEWLDKHMGYHTNNTTNTDNT